MAERSLFRTLLSAVFVLASCQGHRDAETPTTANGSTLLITSEQTEPDLAGIASRQRAFLQAFASAQGDPTSFMSPRFLFRDRANPSDSIGRGPGGVPGSGIDYMKALSARVPPAYADVEAIEVFQQGAGRLVVVTRHPNVLPTVTRWENQGLEWKAISFVINVDEATLGGFGNSR